MTDTTLPKIRIIGLGGTWCSTQIDAENGSEGRGNQVLGASFNIKKKFPAITDFCMPDWHEAMAVDSSNLAISDWTHLAKLLSEERDDYDGFVIMQGTDTLAFTAIALSFALRGFAKPIVLSGSQVPLDKSGTDAVTNLVNATRVASLTSPRDGKMKSQLREVAVVFGSRIIRASRCRKFSERDYEAFDSVNTPAIGTIGTDIWMNEGLLLEPDSSFKPAPKFAEGVVLHHVYPSMKPETLEAVGLRSRGVVLAAFGAGNIPCQSDNAGNPYALEPAIRALADKDIPVVITTQCVTGQAEPGTYRSGTAAQDAGAIIANDLTPEAAYVKLSWLLANDDAWPSISKRALRGGPGFLGAIRHAMLMNFVGEIEQNSKLFPREE